MTANVNLIHQAALDGNLFANLCTEIFQRDVLSKDFRGMAQVYMSAVCGASDAVGACVYLVSASGGTMTVATADPSNPTKLPAIGIIAHKQSSTSCVIQPLGFMGEATLSGLTAGSLYVVGSDGQVAKFGGSNYPAAGSTVQNLGLALSTTTLLLMPALGAQTSAGGNLDYANVAAGTVLTNSTTETTLLSYTIPANTLRAGSIIEIDYAGLIVSAQSTDTFLPKLYIGSSANILGHAALNSTTNDIFTGKVSVLCRSTTSAFPVGDSLHGPPASATPLPVAHAALTIDATVAQIVALKGTWSVAHADNQARGDVLRVQVRR